MENYQKALTNLVNATKSFCDAVDGLMEASRTMPDSAGETDATIAIVECRRMLLEMLNRCPHMSAVLTVTSGSLAIPDTASAIPDCGLPA